MNNMKGGTNDNEQIVQCIVDIGHLMISAVHKNLDNNENTVGLYFDGRQENWRILQPIRI